MLRDLDLTETFQCNWLLLTLLYRGSWEHARCYSQFLVYFAYFLVLFGVYLLGAVLVVLQRFRASRRAPQPPELSPAKEKAMQMLSEQEGGLSSLQPEALPLASQEQNQQPEAKA